MSPARPKPDLVLNGQRVYTTTEASYLSGLSYRQIDYADRTKTVPASIARATGSGTMRLYSAHDIAKLRLLGLVSDANFIPRWARTAVVLLDDARFEDLADQVIVIDHRGRPQRLTLDEFTERQPFYRRVTTVVPCAQLVRGL